VFPDAHETLDRLKELGIKLALITNSAAEPQRAKGQTGYFTGGWDGDRNGAFGAQRRALGSLGGTPLLRVRFLRVCGWRVTRQGCGCQQSGTPAPQTGCIGAGGAATPQ
jgi:hypothetical protein